MIKSMEKSKGKRRSDLMNSNVRFQNNQAVSTLTRSSGTTSCLGKKVVSVPKTI